MLQFIPPDDCSRIDCTIAAVSWKWKDLTLQNSAFKTLQYPFNNILFPATDIPLPLPASRGCLLLTIVSLQFFDLHGERDNRSRYLPCNVVDARYC